MLRSTGGNRLEGRPARTAPLGHIILHGKRPHVELNHERQPGYFLYAAHCYCLAATGSSLEVGPVPGSGSRKQTDRVVLRSFLSDYDVAPLWLKGGAMSPLDLGHDRAGI